MISRFWFGQFSRGRRALAAAATCAVLCAGAFALAKAATIEQVEIVTKNGVQVFVAEIASTDEERATGLMYRKELPQGRGMLFDFGKEQMVVMWMKNTYVSLDMIFIRADGRIARIAENTEPLSEAHIHAGSPVKGVLEVVAGTAKRYGIAPGDKVAHRFFSGR